MRSSTESRTHLDERIVRYIEGKRINVNGIYDDIKEKREFLREVLGYERLKIGSNEFVPIAMCNDSRISMVVKGTYFDAKNRLQQSHH